MKRSDLWLKDAWTCMGVIGVMSCVTHRTALEIYLLFLVVVSIYHLIMKKR